MMWSMCIPVRDPVITKLSTLRIHSEPPCTCRTCTWYHSTVMSQFFLSLGHRLCFWLSGFTRCSEWWMYRTIRIFRRRICIYMYIYRVDFKILSRSKKKINAFGIYGSTHRIYMRVNIRIVKMNTVPDSGQSKRAVYFLRHSPILNILYPGVKTTFLESSHRAEGAYVDGFVFFFFLIAWEQQLQKPCAKL